MKQKQLEKQLRQLPQPETPTSLENRLLATIPQPLVKSNAPTKATWRYIAAGIAAVMFIALGIALYDINSESSVTNPKNDRVATVTQEDMQRMIDREVISARLLTVARMLAENHFDEKQAQKMFGYIADTYSDTTAGNVAKEFIGKEL